MKLKFNGRGDQRRYQEKPVTHSLLLRIRSDRHNAEFAQSLEGRRTCRASYSNKAGRSTANDCHACRRRRIIRTTDGGCRIWSNPIKRLENLYFEQVARCASCFLFRGLCRGLILNYAPQSGYPSSTRFTQLREAAKSRLEEMFARQR